jgi:LAO/AO transport system kinase
MFVETLGLALVKRGDRVAVLCVDPLSKGSRGALLADKATMARLGAKEDTFIRPSTGLAEYEGVGAQTGAAIRFCEAAGYDPVIVETVGVGQNECAVGTMTDMVVLLQEPYAMSDLQVMKRGIYEHVDMVLINKADLAPTAAREAQARIRSTLHMTRHGRQHCGLGIGWLPVVRVISALTGDGLDEALGAIDSYRLGAASEIDARRRVQDQVWLEERMRREMALRG